MSLKTILSLSGAWLLTGCSVGISWMVDNQTSEPVEIFVSPTRSWKVPAHAEKEETYLLGCVMMRIRNVDQRYLFTYAPREYYKGHVFSNTLFGRIDPEGELTLYSPVKPELPHIAVQKGCAQDEANGQATPTPAPQTR